MPTPADERPAVAHVLHRMQYAGAEVLAADLLRKLGDRFAFTVLCLDGRGELGEAMAAEGWDVVDLGRRPGVDLGVARRLGRELKRRRVDLVHAHQYTPFFYAGLGRLLTRTRGTPILFTEHGRHYPDPRKLKHVVANRALLGRQDRVTAVGHFVKRALVANEGIADARIEVIHNGIDVEAFTPKNDASRAEARRRLELADDTPVLMQVARFHPVKDHATAIRALGRLAEAGVAFTMVFVGDGETRGDMESLATACNVRNRCRFVGVRDDVRDLLPAADAFVLSSVSEGVSVTLLEAMATGLPVAATDVGGNGEVVAHRHTGLLSPRGDPDALAQHLALLLADPALRRDMGDAAVHRAHEHFTQSRMHARYAELYDAMTAA